jgi:intergrase/recombinase
MEALAAYAKYSGSYDKWCQIRKRYSLHWTNGDESLQSLQRFFNPGLTLDVMLQRIREMIRLLPPMMAQIVRFGCLVGLRPSEVVESIKLINKEDNQTFQTYYNQDACTLEHFRFPEIFIRRTKKAYISFITKEQLSGIGLLGYKTPIPTLKAIRSAAKCRGLNMDMHLTRKIFASHLRQEGIQPEVVDMLQGRVSQSVLTRHYLVPQSSLKDQVLQALEKLNTMIVIAG